MQITSCICIGISFEKLKEISMQKNLSYDSLVLETGCCSKCSLCKPYVLEMIKTGNTVFNSVIKK